MDTNMQEWHGLKEKFQREADAMEDAAGEKMVEIRSPSEIDLTLVHKKTFKRLNITYALGMDGVKVENSSGMHSYKPLSEFTPSVVVDLMQNLS